MEIFTWLKDVSPELLTQASTVFIAAVAVAVSVCSGWRTRIHNKLMVTPHADSSVTIVNGTFSFKVMNNGIGPAIIKSVSVFYANQRLAQAAPLENATRSLLHEADLYCEKLSFQYLEIESYLLPNQPVELVAASFPSYREANLLKEMAGKHIRILAEYESIYGQLYRFDSSKSVRSKPVGWISRLWWKAKGGWAHSIKGK